jgi:hypothetical protein
LDLPRASNDPVAHSESGIRLKWGERAKASIQRKMGGVQHIEEISPPFQFHAVTDSKLSLDGKVPIGIGKTSKCVAAEVSLANFNRDAKGRRIDSSAAGKGRVLDVQRHSGD